MYEVGDKVIYQGADKNAYKKVGVLKSIEEKDGKPQLTVEFEGGETFTAPVDDWSKEFANAVMNLKFKVGDKVKVVGSGLQSKGKIGEITRANPEYKGWPYKVQFINNPNGSVGEYAEAELTKATSEEVEKAKKHTWNAKFKVGDKVTDGSGVYLVTGIDNDFGSYEWKLISGRGDSSHSEGGDFGWADSKMKIANAAQNAKFKIGDKVKSKSRSYMGTARIIDETDDEYVVKFESGIRDMVEKSDVVAANAFVSTNSVVSNAMAANRKVARNARTDWEMEIYKLTEKIKQLVAKSQRENGEDYPTTVFKDALKAMRGY